MKKLSMTFLAFAGMLAAAGYCAGRHKAASPLGPVRIFSATADQGQAVELSVTEAVKVADQVVIPEGARVTGTITEAQEKRHMGQGG